MPVTHVPEKRGEPIAGSRWYRNFCARCGEPLRVEAKLATAVDLACRDCDPPHLGVGRETSEVVPGSEQTWRHDKPDFNQRYLGH